MENQNKTILEKLDLVGKQFGNYRILGELGRGGMAIVYKADELSLNRVVALKVLSPKISGDETMVKRFQREAQAVAGLNHPNIVHIYAVGSEENINYFTMEYVRGKTLRDLRKQEGRLDPERLNGFIIQTAEALGEAHRAGIIHRDIKPGNLMVDAADRIKVTDFGLAHVVQQAGAGTRLTVDGSFLGTPQYMSPEQCEGKPVDCRSDIYSLGVTFYEILTGKMPVEGDTPGSMLVKIIQGDLRPVREVDPTVPREVEKVIEKMLAKNPAKRYRNTGELIEDLKGLSGIFREDDATVVSVAGGTAPVEPRNRRGKFIAGAAVALLVAVAGLVALANFRGGTGEGSQPETTDNEVNESGTAVMPDAAASRQEETGPDNSEKPPPAAPTRRDPVVSSAVSVPTRMENAPLPPENSAVIAVAGDAETRDLVSAYVSELLAGNRLEIVPGPMPDRKKLPRTAKYLVNVRITHAGTRTLNFYGSSSELRKILISAKAVETDTGKTCAGPFSSSVEYTGINMEKNLKETTAGLCEKLLNNLEVSKPADKDDN